MADRITQRVASDFKPRSPGLNVTVDQGLANGRAAMFSVAGALADASAVSARTGLAVKEQQRAKDVESGKALRMQDDLNGVKPEDTLGNSDLGADVRRGYLQTEAVLQAQKFEEQLKKDALQMEPAADFDTHANESAKAFLEQHDTTDPEYRKVLLGAMERAKLSGRQTFTSVALRETIERQHENLSVLAANGIKDGSLLTTEGSAKFYAYAGSKEFGYLHPREVDALFAQAAVSQLADAKVDLGKTMEFLKQDRPDGTPGIAFNPKYAKDIETAFEAGTRKQEMERAAAMQGAELQAMMRWDDSVKAHRASDTGLLKMASEFGWTNEKVISERRRMQAEYERQAKEHAAKLTDLDYLRMIQSGDPRQYTVEPSKLEGAITATIAAALDTGNKEALQAAFALASKSRVDNQFLQRRFGRLDPTDVKGASTLIDDFNQLAAFSPDYARRQVDTKTMAIIDSVLGQERLLGKTREEALATVARSTPLDRASAIPAIVREMPSTMDTTVPGTGVLGSNFFADSASNEPFQRNWVQNAAIMKYQTGLYSSPKDAIESAQEDFKAKHVAVNGAWVPANGLTPELAKVGEEYLNGLRDHLAKNPRSGYDAETPMRFLPVRDNPGLFQVVHDLDGFPVLQPDGTPATVNLRQQIGPHTQFTASQKANEVLRNNHRKELMADVKVSAPVRGALMADMAPIQADTSAVDKQLDEKYPKLNFYEFLKKQSQP